MTKYRDELPQLGDRIFLMDGGIETTMMFHEQLELPHFASYILLATDAGRQAIFRYFATYAELARELGTGIVLDTPTWRASADWGAHFGHDATDLAKWNEVAVAQLEGIRDELESADSPIVISGNVGPRGDGYDPKCLLSPEEAEAYHRPQISTFARSNADCVTGLTMTHVGEAIGITRAAIAESMPVVISFTVETDGTLPTGQPLGEAILETDAATNGVVAYYMINCAHPTHFEHVLEPDASWSRRIQGLRCNASAMSHAELDEAEELDDGNPAELGAQYRALKERLPALRVVGGCCGTDDRHVEAMGRACLG